MSDNKRIAKNTIYLYFRMILTMLIALYTSRVILEKLGVDDYGIYNAVGGIVGFLSFLNNALATGSSRFLTFELGVGDEEKLKRIFSSLLTVHIILAGIVALIAETVGLWFLYHKMVIPPDRMQVAVYTFHISILTSVLTITQVPYNATIISHERMNVYAYASIFEVGAKLGICYLLGYGNVDRLILYAFLIFIVQAILIVFYRFYCRYHFSETKFSFIWDKSILKPVLSFSGWSLFADGTTALSKQGVLILLNMFFAPAVVSARAISLQVNSAANQLVNNFRTAVNPQIVKLYAVKDLEGSKKLLLFSTNVSYYLMLMISLPLFFLADPILHFWLGDNVPEYTTIFLQIVVVQSLFQVFDRSFYVPLYVKGQLKENAILTSLFDFLPFPVVFVLFKIGYSPVALSWAYLISSVIIGLIVKPILIIKLVDYTWREVFSVFVPCLRVTLIAVIPSTIFFVTIPQTSAWILISEALIMMAFSLVVSYFGGLDKSMRERIRGFIVEQLHIEK
ncbi:lipopolysaccharide biosynthesis protein [Bacteroides intestinalis]|uniref:lipopolysaccharide biosynthesis protein n=1 Tax=Bacteroides intestinalis TaxID=329854 RepID=UPI0022E04231|nr:polysaccharide biosynthesis protein [Bacteroides intestinalis]